MKNVNIDLLNESESGELTGGFSVVEGEGVSETSFSNGNCCKACGTTHQSIKTHD